MSDKITQEIEFKSTGLATLNKNVEQLSNNLGKMGTKAKDGVIDADVALVKMSRSLVEIQKNTSDMAVSTTKFIGKLKQDYSRILQANKNLSTSVKHNTKAIEAQTVSLNKHFGELKHLLTKVVNQTKNVSQQVVSANKKQEASLDKTTRKIKQQKDAWTSWASALRAQQSSVNAVTMSLKSQQSAWSHTLGQTAATQRATHSLTYSLHQQTQALYLNAKAWQTQAQMAQVSQWTSSLKNQWSTAGNQYKQLQRSDNFVSSYASKLPSQRQPFKINSGNYDDYRERRPLQRTRIYFRDTNSEVKKATKSSRVLHEVWRGMTASAGQIWWSWSSNVLALAAGIAPVATMFKSLNAERAFGWQMAQVGAAAEVGNAQVKALGDSILALGGGQYTQSPLQMAESLRVLAQAGLKTHEAFATLPTVLNTAMVAGVSDEKAATFAVGLIEPFNLRNQQTNELDADKFRAAADMTAKAAAVSQTSIEQMMESMKQVAPAADKFGMSVADVTTILALLAKVNITGSSAGTATKNLMTDLAGRTEKAREALKALGLSYYTASGSAKSFMQVMKEVYEKFKGMTDKERQLWQKSFLDERGMRAMDVLLSTSEQSFRQMHHEIARGAENMGYTAVQAERLGHTSEGAFRKMKAAWDTAFVTVGQNTNPAFQGLMDSLTRMANSPQTQASMEHMVNLLLGIARASLSVVNVMTHWSGTIQGLLAGFVSFKALNAATVFFGIASAQTAVAATAGTAAAASTGFAAALKSIVSALSANWWLTGAAVVIGGVIAYLTRAKEVTRDFAQELRQMPKDLGAVKTEIYSAFNETGKGFQLDRMLGIRGDIATEMKRGVADASTAFILSTEHTTQAFADNLAKINAAVASQFDQMQGSMRASHSLSMDAMLSKARESSQAELEQAVLLLDRKNSLMQSELQNVDKHLAGIQELSRQDMDLRMGYEQAIFDNAQRLSALRTELAAKQLEEIRVKAVQEMGLWDRYFGEFADNRMHNAWAMYKRESGTKEASEFTNRIDAVRMTEGLSKEAAFTKVAGSFTIDKVRDTHKALRNLELQKAVYEQIKANPTAAAAKFKDELNELEKYKYAQKQKGIDLPKEFNAVVGGLTAYFTYANNLIAQKIDEQKQYSQYNAKQEREKIALQMATDVPEIPSKKKKGGREKEPVYKAYDPYEPYLPTLREQEQKQARDAVKKRFETERKLFKRVSDETLKAYTDTLRPALEAQLAKERADLVKRANDIRQKMADGKLSAQDEHIANADLKAIEQKIKDLSPKGTVDLGSVGRTITTTLPKKEEDKTKMLQKLSEDGQAIRVADVKLKKNTSTSQTKTVANNTASVAQTALNGDKKMLRAAAHAYAKSLAKSTGWCALYVNNALRAQGFKIYGHGKDVARNLINSKQGFHQVKYDKDYVPQIGDVMSLSPRKGGHWAGHVAIYTEKGWVSDYRQRNRGNTAAPNDHYLRGLQNGTVKATIARRGNNPTATQVSAQSSVKDTQASHSMATSYTGNGTHDNLMKNGKIINFEQQAITAQNAEDGAEFAKRMQEEVEAVKKQTEFQNEMANKLTTEIELKEHMMALDKQRNDVLSNAGMISQTIQETMQFQRQEAELIAQAEKERTQYLAENLISQEDLKRYDEIHEEALRRRLELLHELKSQTEDTKTVMAGIAQGMTDVQNKIKNGAQMARETINILADGTTNIFQKMLLEGKKSFSDLAASILSDMARLYMQQGSLRLFSQVFGGQPDAQTGQTQGAGWLQAGITAISSLFGGGGGFGGGNSAINALFARGGAFDNGRLMAYAGGGVVNTPTYFGMAGGRGLMGEAGSEAIMPLTRMANGDLGVSVVGGGTSGVVVNAPVSVTVTVHSDGTTQSESQAQTDAREMGEAVKAIVLTEVNKMLRHGGAINQAIRMGGQA